MIRNVIAEGDISQVAAAHDDGDDRNESDTTSDAEGAESYSSGSYTDIDGHGVLSPMFTSNAREAASAKCYDESYSLGRHKRGACSHHGGVAQWL